MVQGSTLTSSYSINKKQLLQLTQLKVDNIYEKRRSKNRAPYVSEAEGRRFFCPMLLVIICPVEVLARVTCAWENADKTH